MSICQGCGQEIKWIRTAAGKSMPVDEGIVHFTPAGGPMTFITADGKTVRGEKGKSGTAVGYLPHWASCPAAGYFKRKGGGKT